MNGSNPGVISMAIDAVKGVGVVGFGFIGSAPVDALIAKGFDVTV